MKYTIEVKDGKATETLEFKGKTFTRITNKRWFGSESEDDDFCEQLEKAGIDDTEILDDINDNLDGFLAYTLLNIESKMEGN